MAHKIYQNLAHLDDFPSDLNYTGLVFDGWDHPINVIPLLIILVCVIFGGAPRGPLSVWVLMNAAFIHMYMDGLIGTFGIGPKYLADEYAVLDSRYWPLKDSGVMIISFIELFIMGPLCICWYIAIGKNCWCRHSFCLVASTFQLMGTLLYVFCEIWDNFNHLPAKESWPPTFDSYIKLKYFWFVFVCLNSFWMIIPLILYWSTWQQMKPPKDKQQ